MRNHLLREQDALYQWFCRCGVTDTDEISALLPQWFYLHYTTQCHVSPLLVGAFSACKVSLQHLKGLAVNNRFVGIFEYQDVFRIVLQFVRLGTGFEVHGISHIFLIGEYPANGVCAQ